MKPLAKRWTRCGALILLVNAVLVSLAARTDDAYLEKFRSAFPPVDPLPAWEEYATAARFDALYLADGWDSHLKELNNDAAAIAWGESYRMMALNEMFEATGDTKYLEANLRIIRVVLAATDEKRAKQLSDGRMVAAWGCEQYSKTGRAVHAVHTGIIAAPIAEYLQHVSATPAMRAALGGEFDAMVGAVRAALDVHESHWRDGPGDDEGRYLYTVFEDGPPEQALPGNWQSAMGWAWYRLGALTGDTAHTGRALRLGRYIRARLSPAPDGAFYWPYQLPEQPVTASTERGAFTAEDTSHAGLTMALPFALGKDGQVFTEEDLVRLAHTVIRGFAPETNGVLYPTIDGKSGLDPASYISFPSRWIWLSRHYPEVGERIKAFYLRHRATPAPLDLADLLLWNKEQGD